VVLRHSINIEHKIKDVYCRFWIFYLSIPIINAAIWKITENENNKIYAVIVALCDKQIHCLFDFILFL
jgi:hypothetical protein